MKLRKVLDRRRDFPIEVSRPEHFECEAGVLIDPRVVPSDPTYSLYCFDFERNLALFVRTPEHVDLFQPPFYYLAQFENANAVAEMPFDQFVEMAETIPLPSAGVSFLHSVGRCGSTLLAKALGTMHGVLAISEPDDLTQIALNLAQLDPSWVQRALRASLRWRCKPASNRVVSAVSIKTRAEVMIMAKEMAQAFAQHPTVFLYRDLRSWALSAYRFVGPDHDFDDDVENAKHQKWAAEHVPMAAEFVSDEAPLNRIQLRSIVWASSIEGYLHLHEAGAPCITMRYEDLLAEPRRAFEAVFEFFGLRTDDWSAVMGVLERDSQEGSPFGRDKLAAPSTVLPEALRVKAEAIALARPLIGRPDPVLPRDVFREAVRTDP